MKKHSIVNLDKETKNMYLKGVASMINIDDDIDKKEKDYLKFLSNSLDLDENSYNEAMEFSKSLNQEILINIINKINEKNISIPFLIDLLVIRDVDNKIREKENKLFNVFLSRFNTSDVCIDTIRKFVACVKNKDYEACGFLGDKNSFFKLKNFDYLLEFYE